jgi:hypothetical protein
MHTTLYVDPGIRCTGASVFDGPLLVRAAMLRALDVPQAFSQARAFLHGASHVACTIELPQVYGAARQAGDQNDLVSLALIAGAWGALMQARGVEAAYVRPAAWKGQTPKDVMHKRMHAALDASERVALTAITGPPHLRHNAYDAVCMGLKQNGRLG